MTNLNLITKKIIRKELKASANDSSKLLADFLKGVVIQVDEEYIYE